MHMYECTVSCNEKEWLPYQIVAVMLAHHSLTFIFKLLSHRYV